MVIFLVVLTSPVIGGLLLFSSSMSTVRSLEEINWNCWLHIFRKLPSLKEKVKGWFLPRDLIGYLSLKPHQESSISILPTNRGRPAFSLFVFLICMLAVAGTGTRIHNSYFFPLSSRICFNRWVLFNLPFSLFTWKVGQSPNMSRVKQLTFYLFSVFFKIISHQ